MLLINLPEIINMEVEYGQDDATEGCGGERTLAVLVGGVVVGVVRGVDVTTLLFTSELEQMSVSKFGRALAES